MTPEDYLLMCDAAKAAGYDIWWKSGTCKGGPYLSAFIGDKPWRPLEDDGDAFRLMTNCTLRVGVFRRHVEVDGYFDERSDAFDFHDEWGTDKKPTNAEIRMCILKGAAKIGRDMFYA